MDLAIGLSVLVVEDHEFQRNRLIRVLQKFCFDEIHHAAHGVEALTKLNIVKKIDLIICDLDMPEMDGIEFMRHLSDLGHPASIVISSAKDYSLTHSVEKMAKAYGLRLLGVIEKPVNTASVIKLIHKHKAFAPKILPTGNREFSLDEILEGIKQDQFQPFFQAKVDFQSGNICGAEALARWIHPDYGVIPPFAFITQLENSGNIDLLTFDMLKKAIEACKRWSEDGKALTISINLSLAGLNDSSVVNTITSIAKKIGLDPKYVILEITETAAMTESTIAIEILSRLKMRGFGLSVDDYGTGFSSLKQLTRVSFSELKIDQSFVTGSVNEPSLQTIVESSIIMAKGLGLTTVAEGIEEQAEWELLKSLGCEIGQGYFISKPISEVEFIKFVSQSCK